jgi:hypothetical protein
MNRAAIRKHGEVTMSPKVCFKKLDKSVESRDKTPRLRTPNVVAAQIFFV